MTRRNSPRALRGRTKVFRFVRFVGRWSMIDIFMLSVLVGAMRFGRIASVTPGMGAAAFCAVVLLTMVATELFDPRLMWDAAGRSEQPVEGTGAPDAVPGATPELTREELRGAA
jgi:paraquat-inducible protein A